MLKENKRIDEPKAYETDPLHTDAVNTEDNCIDTSIANPGTDDDNIYELSIAKYCSVRVILSLLHLSL